MLKYDPFVVGPRALLQRVRDTGVHCRLGEGGGRQEDKTSDAETYRRSLLGSLVFTIPIVIIAWVVPR